MKRQKFEFKAQFCAQVKKIVENVNRRTGLISHVACILTDPPRLGDPVSSKKSRLCAIACLTEDIERS